MLKFDNVSGPGVASKHVTSFIKYANDATSLYKGNINANLNYGSLSRASKKYAECREMLIKVDVSEFGQTTCWSLKE